MQRAGRGAITLPLRVSGFRSVFSKLAHVTVAPRLAPIRPAVRLPAKQCSILLQEWTCSYSLLDRQCANHIPAERHEDLGLREGVCGGAVASSDECYLLAILQFRLKAGSAPVISL